MAIVVLDLEWNQGFPATPEQKFNEIIQIGAVRMDTWDSEPVVFSQWVRPMYHRALHFRVRELVPVEKKTLRNAPNFFQALNKFRSWCGEDVQFVTWGAEDLRVFHENLDHYHLDKHWITEEYDLQKAFGYLCFDTSQQYSLKAAIAHCQLDAPLTFHDASHDAYYTALVGKWLLQHYIQLPETAELDRIFAQRAEERRIALLDDAARMAGALVETGTPLTQWECGPFPTAIACASSRDARLLLCPECRNKLYHINYFPVDNGRHFIAKARCSVHSTYYTLLSMQQDSDGQFHAIARVYDKDSDASQIFKICAKYEEPAKLEHRSKSRAYPRRRKSRRQP